MSASGITLLILGVVIFVISFFIPDKGDKQTRKDKEKQQEEIRRMMEKELDGMKLRVNEATNETVEYGMDRCERALEKVSNDKIMAVSEYAATIMEELDKNHKEIMFLYDMLNDKQVDIKNTVRKAEATAKEVNDVAKNVQTSLETTQNEVYQEQPQVIYSEPVQQVYQEPVVYHGEIDESIFDNMTRKDLSVSEPAMPTSVFNSAMVLNGSFPIEEEVVVGVIEKPVETESVVNSDDYREATFSSGENNNQKILMMHSEGASVVDIARALNLGVGEVKLVIDLYNG